jgi:hypothetical protein
MHDEDDGWSPFAGGAKPAPEGGSRTGDIVDAAARDLTRGEPSPQLRERVRARIGRRRGWLVAARVPVLGAAIAMVLVAVAVQESRDAVPLPPAPPAVHVASSFPVAAGTGAGRLEQLERPERLERPTRAKRILAIDPLVIEPIAMPPIAVTASSGVTPIAIDDLRIEPLRIQ